MSSSGERTTANDVVGVIPAAGRATRLPFLPCSKELFPVGFMEAAGENVPRAKVASHYILDTMRVAGITKVFVVLRKGKWDIPAYWGDGSIVSMNLAYVVLDTSPGVPFTIDGAYPFVQHATVAFGFPDILFGPEDAFSQLITCHKSSNADVTLGLFPADCPGRVDMVDVGERGKVREIVIQPRDTSLRYSWGIAVWTPVLTQFLREKVASWRELGQDQPEVSVGRVFQFAIDAGLSVSSTIVSRHPYVDIGTPEGLVGATQLAVASFVSRQP
jgi:glucose-1-phosphate thymidylyltransferase